MIKKNIISKNNKSFVFRELQKNDFEMLGDFFASLSKDTRGRFGPHPLTYEYAQKLCLNVNDTNVIRFIVENGKEIVGYFILDFNLFENEMNRYSSYGICIDSKIDPVFAPCIADKYQNEGIASQAMKIIIDFAIDEKLRSIILMGGTQESNSLAIAFYKKFGFKEYGQFYTDFNNIDMMLKLPNS